MTIKDQSCTCCGNPLGSDAIKMWDGKLYHLKCTVKFNPKLLKATQCDYLLFHESYSIYQAFLGTIQWASIYALILFLFSLSLNAVIPLVQMDLALGWDKIDLLLHRAIRPAMGLFFSGLLCFSVCAIFSSRTAASLPFPMYLMRDGKLWKISNLLIFRKNNLINHNDILLPLNVSTDLEKCSWSVRKTLRRSNWSWRIRTKEALVVKFRIPNRWYSFYTFCLVIDSELEEFEIWKSFLELAQIRKFSNSIIPASDINMASETESPSTMQTSYLGI